MRVCNFFEWIDEESYTSEKKVIAALMLKIEEMKKREMLLIVCLGISMFFFMVSFVGYVSK